MAANYLSLLMSSVNVSTSDDSDITNTHSTGQVDYLSHQWREEDVWHSWRRMTRQKNEIANGTRLENASWRTWWKQRNGLQTVNPETLNWLKDSDVTWLYGPLHTAEDIRPAILRSGSNAATTNPTRVNTPPPSPSPRVIDFGIPKPILKHRTVTELLISTLPPPGSTTGLVDVTSLDTDVTSSSQSSVPLQDPSSPSSNRPVLLHTRSETNILGHSPFRKDSPPRIIASDSEARHRNSDYSDHARHHSPSTSSTPHGNPDTSARKHIAFNTFVEQCIAIDKPNPYSESITSSVNFHSHESSPPPSPIQQRGPYEYVHYSPRPSYQAAWRQSRDGDSNDEIDVEDDEDEDEDVRIEVKTRSRSSSFVSKPGFGHVDSNNGKNERVTIASIAPTLLKTSSHSHTGSPAASSLSLSVPRHRGPTYCKPHPSDLVRPAIDDESDASDGEVPLLWVPPAGSGYEREFSVAEIDDPSTYAYNGGRIGDERGREGRTNGQWVVTPPVDDALNADVTSSDRRQGRFSRLRHDERRRGRDPRSAKLRGSLSPAEVPSSNTDSSESRSRSRNRTNLLPPRSNSRSRSRSSSAEQRSSSSSGRVVSPDMAEDRQLSERGRPLVRRCDSDSDMCTDKMARGAGYGLGGIHAQRAHTQAPPPANARGVALERSDKAVARSDKAVADDSMMGAITGTMTSPQLATGVSGSSPGTLSGIRGYIGGIWS